MIKFTQHIFFTLAAFLLVSASAFAQTDTVTDVATNAVSSIANLPGFITAMSYMAGLVLGVAGIFKLKEHVENPQTPIKAALIRFAIGAALLSLPIVFEAMKNSIDGGVGGATNYFGFGEDITLASPTGSLNTLFNAFLTSVSGVPGLLTAAGYLLGLVFGIIALFKMKAHVENPEQNPMKDAVVYFLVGGGLLVLPYIYSVMMTSIVGDTAGFSLLQANMGLDQTGEYGAACAAPANADGLGSMVCTIIGSTTGFAIVLQGLAYLAGLVLGFFALLKIRDHVLNPTQTPISQGLVRLMAGGMFLSLPYVVSVIIQTVLVPSGGALSQNNFNSPTTACGTTDLEGLGKHMYCAVTDLLGPMHDIVNYFAMGAGIIFIMIGISRLLKSEQDGARGPGGIGTIMTFITGGLLISFNSFLQAASVSLFSKGGNSVNAALQYTTGLADAEKANAHMVIGAILKFMIIVGLISFVRGIFIIRSSAEGDNQASIMAGVTHIIAGALAVNMGPLLNAVQATLGVAKYGIKFT